MEDECLPAPATAITLTALALQRHCLLSLADLVGFRSHPVLVSLGFATYIIYTCRLTSAYKSSTMASDISMLASFDAWISDVLAGWDTYSTLILSAIVAFAIYSFVFAKEPDIHPFLLARQATASPVRQEGESAAYRSLETPHGFPLRSGLNVKDPGSPKWTSGRRGDLRDVWKAAARGAINPDGSVSGKQGKIYTVLGKTAIEHSLDQVTQEINVIGKHLQSAQVKTVAICLTDSVELLAAIFG